MNFKIIPNEEGSTTLTNSSNEDIQICEKKLDITFEDSYKQYVITYGAGILGDYIRVYTPEWIIDVIDEWKERITEYWFWDKGQKIITKQNVLKSVIIGDTCNGDEIIFYNNQYFVLPRHQEMIYKIGNTLHESIDWLCSSGILIDSFSERDFQPL